MTSATTQAITATAGIEFADVDPRTLTVETNVRVTANLDKEFVASIRDLGVLQPILAVRENGTLRVRAGQRRTLAAIEAGLATIPARIIDATGTDADRIVEQMTENEQRTNLTDADRSAAYQQMALLGIPAGQIAKRLHTKKTTVDNGLAVAQSTIATAVIAEHDLTLAQALVLIEFEDDLDIVKALTIVAVQEPAQFEHTAQRLRDERAAQQAHDALVADLTGAGVQIIDRPGWDEKTITDLSGLLDQAGERLTSETHATCPGRAAHVSRSYSGLRAVHVCLDPKTHGHPRASASGSTVATGPMTEEQKADRRAVIAGNKAWKSAETVRREWLRTFAARKTAPKDAPALVAYVLVTCTNDLTHAAQQGHALARTALGLDTAKPTGWGGYAGERAITDAINAASPARTQLIGLVVAMSAIEARTGTHTWRNPTDDVTRYLRAIASWGYDLAAIEQSAIDHHDARTTADRHDDDTDDTHGDHEGDEYEGEDDLASLDAAE